jgi:hypothetical protein
MCRLPIAQKTSGKNFQCYQYAAHKAGWGSKSSFSDGSDGENPTILVYNYTGHYSRIEFSPQRLQVICNGLVEKYKKIEPDFNINVSTDLIGGGFYWQWSDQQQANIAIHDFSVRICYYGNLRELEAAIDQVADRLITRYSKNL